MRRPTAVAAHLGWVIMVGILAPPMGSVKAAPAAERPNVLFIMTDQQFADAMSCRMGNQYIHTPAMDGLAKTGMMFTRAYTSNPLCMPARNSIFTGRYPHETKITKNGGPQLDPREFASMGSYFQAAGYETAYFGKWHLRYDPRDKQSHGFETAECLHGNGHDSEVGDLATKYVAGKSGDLDAPFLAVVSLSNPHDVCQLARHESLPSGPIGNPPPPERCPPVPANLDPPKNETDTMAVLRKGYQGPGSKFPVGNYTDDQWRQLRWGYYRLVEMVDGEIGRVLASLRKAGREQDTLIVFTSDHGECAGAHRFNQKTVFYEESARVPLIVCLKGRTEPATCDRLVNTGIDILPTLLDFAGIAAPKKLTGRSLRPIALGGTPDEWRDHVVIQNHLSQSVRVDGFRAATEGRMVRSERYKYCVYGHGIRRESLVDMREDPLETVNLAQRPEYRQALLDHRELLRDFGKAHRDDLVKILVANDVEPRPFLLDEKARGRR